MSAFHEEVATERVRIFPADLTRLGELARVNQELLEDEAVGRLRLLETVGSATELAQTIGQSLADRAKLSGSGAEIIHLELDAAQQRALSLSRTLGFVAIPVDVIQNAPIN